ncbi:hypothetical protein N7495_002690 [Penicillium taxi]|uniref:uncharacterized protein n=1 Tax=Penicillium taxi TaxID=168475 RepID=UPI002545858A|nr:uncharacterized protein N7495_002690 [Penicillium taxi]KAJ5902162.1 hypothetical protein N7495_002690 [Penicillium taxi]
MAAKRPRAAFEAEDSHSPYAFYGTPLPPLDDSTRDDGSYMPVWKQEVTDERGRKRLHGAFTGGFSAGYFNSVGSKEGWTPSTFVSSRQNRARDAKQATQQRPEDFMDEEDLREQEEAQKLQTSDEFAAFGSTETDTTRRAGLLDILMPGGETMGVKLLKKMGWREGQGIGPKVRRNADLGQNPTGDEESGESYLFAPENPPMVSFVRKTDRKGLGYEGELGIEDSTKAEPENSDSFFGKRLAIKDKEKPAKSKDSRRGFGVGVLNDTGSDDEDPYSIGPQISYNRTIGGDRKKKKIKPGPAIASANPLLENRPVFISKKMAAARGGFKQCRDGRLPLEGFLLADLVAGLALSDKVYEAPQIPEGWTSAIKRSSTERDALKYVSTADAAKASSLDSTSRAAVLGESQLPGKSVFDWMTPEARERIAKLTGNTNLPPALSEKAPKGFEVSDSVRRRDLWDLVPNLDKQVAVQALTRAVSGWMPYAEDLDKRARYRSYLEVRAGIRDSLPDRIPGSSTNDWMNEMQEFARAAEVFKPMSGIMASRFTSASSGPKSASDAPDSSEVALSKPAEKPDPPAIAAAKVGMFGHMTRSSDTFYPSRLLCKRFNVKPPRHVQSDPGEQPGGSNPGPGTRFQPAGYQQPAAKELVSQEVMNVIMAESGLKPHNARPDATPGSGQVPLPVVQPEHNEALEAERPDQNIFKAIFGSDDEGSESGDDL